MGNGVDASNSPGESTGNRDHVRDENQLRAEWYQALVDLAPDVIYSLDLNGCLASVSPAFERITGWAPEEWIGQPFAELVHPEDLPLAFETFKQGLQGQDVAAHELRIRCRSGDYVVGEFSSKPRIVDERVVGTIGVARDVTDRRRAQEALQQSEASFRLIFAGNPYPMWVYDLETLTFLEVNDAAIARYGYTRDEFLAMRITDIRPEKDVPRLMESIEQLRGNLDQSEGWCHQTKDGRLIDVEITSHTLTFAGRPAALVLAQDVTERKRSTEALQESEERLTLILETIADGILITATDGRYVYANPAAERMLGVPRSRIVGSTRDAHLWRIITIDGRPDVPDERPTLRTLRTGEPVYGAELVIERADGSRGVLSISTALLRDSTGVIGVVNSLSDLTERKRTEEQLVELLDREQSARATAEAAVLVREDFLSMASHELRTPLTTLHVQMELLRRTVSQDSAPSDPEDVRRQTLHRLEAVDRQLARFSKLITHLLDVSQIAAGRLALEPAPMDLVALTNEVVDRFRHDRKTADCEIEVHADGPVVGTWDWFRIDQVVTNLVANAVKYGHNKPVTITVERDNTSARLSVRDEGIGIADDDLSRIFERFERLVSSANYSGFGLGLYIVRQIVDAHSGTIEVESETGVGSTFTVELPLAQ